MQDERVLYIGMARQGLGRSPSRTHHRVRDLRSADLMIWAVKLPKVAYRLEQQLIAFFGHH